MAGVKGAVALSSLLLNLLTRPSFCDHTAKTMDNGSKEPVLRLGFEPRAEEVKRSTRRTTLVFSEHSGGWLGTWGRDSGAAIAYAVLQKLPSCHIFSPNEPPK